MTLCDTESLPAAVHRVELEGKQIFLVATAHVSRHSVEDVRATLDAVRPRAVCVELCQARFENLTNRESWRKLNIARVLRDGKAMLLLSSLIMTSFQKRIARKLGVTPGAEMLEAIEGSRRQGAELVLADRDIQVTLKRSWARLGFWNKWRMLFQLVASFFVGDQIDEKTIEDLKKETELADLLENLARAFPMVKETLIDERDVYLAQRIRHAPGERVVAVVGAGHVPGILREIQKETPVDALEEIPAPSVWPRLLKWAIPVAILALIAYGFYRGGAQHSLQSILLWLLINGTLSALGAAVAFGHPIAVGSAFLAAPLTSLNPMVAAGWVAGLVQAWIRKPRVEDLEDLPDAITTLRGFWMNPVCRILLVVALANLGSALGTVIAGGWIAARSF